VTYKSSLIVGLAAVDRLDAQEVRNCMLSSEVPDVPNCTLLLAWLVEMPIH